MNLSHQTPCKPVGSSATSAPPGTCSQHDLNPEVELLSPEVLDSLRRTTYRIVSNAHLRQEWEDELQEALLRFCQAKRETPDQPFTWYVAHCAFFTRNRLRQGKSVDSLKRQALGSVLCLEGAQELCQELAHLVFEADPAQEASARDALEQLRIRLTPRECTILDLLLQRHGTREIARELNLSHSVVCRARCRMRSAALKTGFCP